MSADFGRASRPEGGNPRADSRGELGRVYEHGELLMRQGEVGDTMLVIQDGVVEIVREHEGRETLLRTAGEGEMLGEMAVFLKEVRSASVRARGRVRAITIDKKNFMRRISEDPSIAFRLVETMSKRVRELSEELARVKGAARA